MQLALLLSRPPLPQHRFHRLTFHSGTRKTNSCAQLLSVKGLSQSRGCPWGGSVLAYAPALSFATRQAINNGYLTHQTTASLDSLLWSTREKLAQIPRQALNPHPIYPFPVPMGLPGNSGPGTSLWDYRTSPRSPAEWL